MPYPPQTHVSNTPIMHRLANPQYLLPSYVFQKAAEQAIEDHTDALLEEDDLGAEFEFINILKLASPIPYNFYHVESVQKRKQKQQLNEPRTNGNLGWDIEVLLRAGIPQSYSRMNRGDSLFQLNKRQEFGKTRDLFEAEC
ncbi:hypothetical protein BDP27DRAFT_1367242 [Rhodocollybia butyracea]|uniref:Uncharacterized protein n=1 Tax=Rhodocollybia butyracea TaxID=206335 RepID=A0A9P5PLX3_9AGAR|nr:hypothetical protein BDP27DRAFT_1367242 [Rhodocollybia butyracea]